jgi:hypothetical protein
VKQQSREKAAMKTKPLRHQTPVGKNADLSRAATAKMMSADRIAHRGSDGEIINSLHN